MPSNISKLLTPRALAYWGASEDDGSLQNKGLHLSTYGFTLTEVNLLKSTLETLFMPLTPVTWILSVLFIIIKKDIDFISEKKVWIK